MTPRDLATRKADTLAHLVPLSLAWVRERLVVAVSATSRTARDLGTRGRCRMAVGRTRDVTMVDAVLERTVLVDADDALAAAHAAQADRDPRGTVGYVYLVLRPDRVQAWREVDEIAGRTLMRDGVWLV